MAMMAQVMQGGGSGQAMYDQVQSQLVSDQTQLRISLGLNSGGSGNYNLTQAPSSVYARQSSPTPATPSANLAWAWKEGLWLLEQWSTVKTQFKRVWAVRGTLLRWIVANT
jgi:hypothetical protein